jgi:hypothetical protein
MSSPLLRPDDPRFKKPDPRDEQGKNRFADPDAVVPAGQPGDNVFAAASAGERPYQPQYLATTQPRGILLLVLAIVGLSGNAASTLALSGAFMLAWALPWLSIVPAGAAALLASEDLRAMRLGAMDARDRTLTRIAFWLGVVGVLGSLLGIALTLAFALGFWAAG